MKLTNSLRTSQSQSSINQARWQRERQKNNKNVCVQIGEFNGICHWCVLPTVDWQATIGNLSMFWPQIQMRLNSVKINRFSRYAGFTLIIIMCNYNLPFQILAPWTIWKINVKWNGSTEMVTQVEGIHIPQGFLRVRSVAYKMFEKNKKIQYSSVNHHSASFSYLYQSACHLFIQPEFEAKMGPLGRSANPVLLSVRKMPEKIQNPRFWSIKKDFLRVIPTKWHSIWHFSGILSDRYSDIFSDMFPRILSDRYCNIPSGILSDIFSDIFSGILSDICCAIPSGILSDICEFFWHSIRHRILSSISSGIFLACVRVQACPAALSRTRHTSWRASKR